MKNRNRFFPFVSLSGLIVVLLFLTSGFTFVAGAPENPSVGPLAALPTKTPTPKGKTPSNRFTISSSNKVKPKNVFSEVIFGGKGGGPDCSFIKPFEISGITYLGFDGTINDKVTQGHQIHGFVCGWKKDEMVEIRLVNSSGKVVISQKQKAELSGTLGKILGYYIDFDLFVPVDGPLGEYKVELKANSGFATKKFKVVAPKGAQVVQQSSTQLFFYAFSPKEKVRVYAYKPVDEMMLTFAGWAEYQVDANGRLLLVIDLQYEYTVIGDKAGLVYGANILASSCQGAPAPRMEVGKKGRVTYSTGQKVRVRRDANTRAMVDSTIPEGTVFSVVDGPKCNDGFLWWKIQLKDRTQGWVAEGVKGNYFIEPR